MEMSEEVKQKLIGKKVILSMSGGKESL